MNSEYLQFGITTDTVLEGVGINFISALSALIVFFFVFKKFNPITKISPKDTFIYIHEHYRNIGWPELISQAKEIEINVIYFELHFGTNSESYKTFFKNGGKLKLILPNLNNENLMNEYNQMFEEYDTNTIKHKIRETERIIDNIFKVAANHESLQKKYIDQKITYFYYNLDNKNILLSIFENVKDGIVSSPCFLIKNDKLPQSFDENFWKKEFIYFWDNCIK